MNTATIIYDGDLRTTARHDRSGQEITTDAPVDNNGKGEAFSPTDLLAASLVSCMITVMGIRAQKSDLDMGEVKGTVQKIMADNPRRVSSLMVELKFRNHNLSGDHKKILEKVALTCPVAQSIHPAIKVDVEFNW